MLLNIIQILLTDKNIGHQSGRKAKHDDQNIGNRQIYDEKIGDGAHAR